MTYTVPKHNRNLGIKTEPLPAGADALEMYGICLHTSDKKPRHLLLRLIQPRQARIECGESDYFWNSIFYLQR